MRLDEEIQKAKDAGYAFALDADEVDTFRTAALRKIKAHIDPTEESIRQDLAFVTNLVNLKKAERLLGDSAKVSNNGALPLAAASSLRSDAKGRWNDDEGVAFYALLAVASL